MASKRIRASRVCAFPRLTFVMGIFVALALALIVSLAASAQDGAVVSSVSVVDLMRSCEKQDPLNLECSGYIIGVFDTLSLSGTICPPYNREGGTYQAVSVALKFLREHPERWHIHPSALLVESFKAAFPCGHRQ